MAKWSFDFAKYAKESKQSIDGVQRGFAFNLYASIVQKTPVDTGRARGNWNISIGKEDTSTSDKNKGMKYKSKNQIPSNNGDEAIFISNGLPYIGRLEHGYSKQAPQGMVALAVANKKALFDRAVAEEDK